MDPPEAIFQLLAVAKRESFSQKVVKKKVVSGIMEVVKTKSCVHFEEVFFLVLTILLQLNRTFLG